MGKDSLNLDSSLFRINLPTNSPDEGVLLVAEPFLREECFNHAVITLIDYQQGKTAMGLVLNKPTNYTLSEAVDGINADVKIPLFCGGPVSCDRLFYLHSLPDEFPGARKVADGLFIGGDFEKVKNYVNMGLPTDGFIRFFVGYSGWEPEQLEDEIERHVWAVTSVKDNDMLLRDEGDSFWHKVVKQMGPSYRHWLYHPNNPQMN